jgi:nitrite reductase/ring-hydroxylating ferredoxin subunit
MARKDGILVGKTSEFTEGSKKIVPNGKSEIGVYLVKGNWYAYQNLCPHQGGPACEGLLMAKVEEVIAPDRTYQGMRFNHDEMHIVCPWHGWEFDIANGEAVADRKWKLRRYDVEVRGEEVYVLA